MEDHEIQLVRQSFGRCTLNDGFLTTFYEFLIGASDEIEAMFARTDMPQQRRLLKEGLIHLISYSTGNEFSRQRLRVLGESHNRDHLNVRPELYDIWIESLVESVRRHDESYTPELESAWRKAVAPGIETMKSLYAP